MNDPVEIFYNQKQWDKGWADQAIEDEIKKLDFYGLRQWILKYTPREGAVLEAGCGLGRYVFYLNRLGISCMGLDFSESAISKLEKYRKEKNLGIKFYKGDVQSLPFPDGSLSGYISLGVVEHFIEGPQKALEEAFRVLRPGGIAIISTPSFSFSQVYLQFKAKLKRTLKQLIGRPVAQPRFSQYWYSPGKLKHFVQKAGLKTVLSKGADLLYSFYELGFVPRFGSAFVRMVSRLENTFLANIGAQSVTISYKPGPDMHCFFCGKKNVSEDKIVTVIPLCGTCLKEESAKYYKKPERPQLHYPTRLGYSPSEPDKKYTCDYCNSQYETDEIFKDFGFAKKACPGCLKNPEINLELSNRCVRISWASK